jgi:hypothetical protein
MYRKRTQDQNEQAIPEALPIGNKILPHSILPDLATSTAQIPAAVQEAWKTLLAYGVDPSNPINATPLEISSSQIPGATRKDVAIPISQFDQLPNYSIKRDDPESAPSQQDAYSSSMYFHQQQFKSSKMSHRVIENKQQLPTVLPSKLVMESSLNPNEVIGYASRLIISQLMKKQSRQQVFNNLGPVSLATDQEQESLMDRTPKRQRLDVSENIGTGPTLSTLITPVAGDIQTSEVHDFLHDPNKIVSITVGEVEMLHETIQNLERRVAELTDKIDIDEPLPPRAFVLHRVTCACSEHSFTGTRRTVYLDPPRRITADRKWHLQGDRNAPEQGIFLEQNKDVVLVIYKNYSCKADAARFQWQDKLRPKSNATTTRDNPPTSSAESMLINSEILKQALIWASSESQTASKPKISFRTEIGSPYHYFYYDRSSMLRRLNRMDEEHQAHLKIFLEHVEKSFESSFQEANELFIQGLVSFETIHYLFEPEAIVVSKVEGDSLAHVATSWLEDIPDRQDNEIGRLSSWSWKFDGSFRKVAHDFTLEWPWRRELEVRQIQDLSVYPLRYAKHNLEKELQARGRKFWSCRNRIYVSYNDDKLVEDPVIRGERYMVDFVMFKQFDPKAFPTEPDIGIMEPPFSKMEIPLDQFFLLLPSMVFGFSMQTKRWVPLKAACIAPVEWNLGAFDNLVVDEDTKELVKALVTNQLTAEKATDLMEGKGNGLVILLHGGPGTGKTLTAESVAELAKKPLYRVACGDIGTNADAIDKHLQRVLILGRHWGCVVLLDEADVFLEERSLADMQRNALVSVFLRVLEYYDGILILTSNRVGTFDEAFKSRIQLALHYENLTRGQRRKIWANFVNRLERIEKDNVNTESLIDHLDELAGHDMNGRQIRNALTTARQLALYKGRKMDYGLLKHAIGVAGKFDQYLKNVKHNFSDDELAREGQIR